MSIPLRMKDIPTQRQLTRKKKRVWRWKPSALFSLEVSLSAPPTKGNTPKAKFCNISMIPKPVPSSCGLMSMGTVGTMMAQKMAMHIPRRKEGSQRTNSLLRMASVDSVIIMKRQVNVKKQQEKIKAQLRFYTRSTMNPSITTKSELTQYGNMRYTPASQVLIPNIAVQQALPLSRKGMKRASASIEMMRISQKAAGKFDIYFKFKCSPPAISSLSFALI